MQNPIDKILPAKTDRGKFTHTFRTKSFFFFFFFFFFLETAHILLFSWKKLPPMLNPVGKFT